MEVYSRRKCLHTQQCILGSVLKYISHAEMASRRGCKQRSRTGASTASRSTPHDPSVRSKPELYEVAMNSQLSSQLSDSTIATLGGGHALA